MAEHDGMCIPREQIFDINSCGSTYLWGFFHPQPSTLIVSMQNYLQKNSQGYQSCHHCSLYMYVEGVSYPGKKCFWKICHCGQNSIQFLMAFQRLVHVLPVNKMFIVSGVFASLHYSFLPNCWFDSFCLEFSTMSYQVPNTTCIILLNVSTYFLPLGVPQSKQ